MNQRSALITGITGQDGSYLAEFLLEKDYKVYGLIRRKAQQETELGNVSHLEGDIEFIYGDVTDSSSVHKIVHQIIPNEIYNLAGQSHVRISFDIPEYTFRVNAEGPLNFLEASRQWPGVIKFYQAGTSEIFGERREIDGSQNETTIMRPVSPYGTSKLAAHHLVQNYRNAYAVFACNGILFNHESPRRGQMFVTQKIVQRAVEIQMGKAEELILGNLNVWRDWGHAKDYVRAMWLMMQHVEPDDFVIATGRAAKLSYILEFVFERLEMDWKLYVRTDSQFVRPNEVPYLKGDASKAERVLNWKPEFTLEATLEDMIKGAKKKLDGSIYR